MFIVIEFLTCQKIGYLKVIGSYQYFQLTVLCSKEEAAFKYRDAHMHPSYLSRR